MIKTIIYQLFLSVTFLINLFLLLNNFFFTNKSK